MKRDDIYILERLLMQFANAYKELSTVSANTPKEELGKLKMTRINSLLTQANAFLDVSARPFNDFTVFSDDNITYSDAVLVTGQYVECFKAFRDGNMKHRYGKWFWVVDSEDNDAEEKRYIAVNDTKSLDD